MIKTLNQPVIYKDGKFLQANGANCGYEKTMSHKILAAHNTLEKTERGGRLQIKFDALTSHDITYVGIIQTAKGSGLEKFPVPYVLTNCHNSLCAVGGTINEDDHVFGLSAAKKYGGIFVPAHMAVIHSFMRENFAGAGKMILGSDSHTRYGALGTMAIGEGGPELAKQLVGRTYDIAYPEVIAVRLSGSPRRGVGPQDISLLLIGEVFKSGFVKNKVLEFVGDGIKNLPQEYRNGIDVMTTETACLTSIWQTDDVTKAYLAKHGRIDAFSALAPEDGACYDGAIEIDLDKAEPMIAMPYHPSNVFKLRDVADGKLRAQQAIIAGCAGGTFDNIAEAAAILEKGKIGTGEFGLSVYPGSQPINYALTKSGISAKLLANGATLKTAFCGPCFGAGDVPANGTLSIRHTTRNFESREGSKPGDGQTASVALMDARSIAATAANGGILTSALDLDYDNTIPEYEYNPEIYAKRVYNGWGKEEPETELVYGPNIKDWPEIPELSEDLEITLASVINDPVTTTDELIPSGETSSYRSNPYKLAEFTLSRKDPEYVKRAKEIGYGSGIYAKKPGDGSAREQAASCQRVLGGVCNIAEEYATKRYRSNLINWGMLPFLSDEKFSVGDKITVKNIKSGLAAGAEEFEAKVYNSPPGRGDGGAGGVVKIITLKTGNLTQTEREIILAGCLMNYYKKGLNK